MMESTRSPSAMSCAGRTGPARASATTRHRSSVSWPLTVPLRHLVSLALAIKVTIWRSLHVDIGQDHTRLQLCVGFCSAFAFNVAFLCLVLLFAFCFLLFSAAFRVTMKPLENKTKQSVCGDTSIDWRVSQVSGGRQERTPLLSKRDGAITRMKTCGSCPSEPARGECGGRLFSRWGWTNSEWKFESSYVFFLR